MLPAVAEGEQLPWKLRQQAAYSPSLTGTEAGVTDASKEWTDSQQIWGSSNRESQKVAQTVVDSTRGQAPEM
jgi:hypothetical protein